MNFQSDPAPGLHGVRHTEGRHGLQILQVGVSLSFPTRQCCAYSDFGGYRGREILIYLMMVAVKDVPCRPASQELPCC